jgi:hypothetical protein
MEPECSLPHSQKNETPERILRQTDAVNVPI